MEMNTHEKDVHKVTKYHCDLCDNYFTKFEKLEEHKTKKHNIGQVPCNEYNYKALNLSMIDDLIAQCHVMKKNKDIDIRDVTKNVVINYFGLRKATNLKLKKEKDVSHAGIGTRDTVSEEIVVNSHM